jgi:hypothetical protein
VVSWDDEKRQVEYVAIQRKLVGLFLLVEKNRIYLPEPVCELLNNFLVIVKRNAVGMKFLVPPIERSSNPTLHEQDVQVFRQVFESVHAKITDARAALEKEFKTIVGA